MGRSAYTESGKKGEKGRSADTERGKRARMGRSAEILRVGRKGKNWEK